MSSEKKLSNLLPAILEREIPKHLDPVDKIAYSLALGINTKYIPGTKEYTKYIKDLNNKIKKLTQTGIAGFYELEHVNVMSNRIVFLVKKNDKLVNESNKNYNSRVLKSYTNSKFVYDEDQYIVFYPFLLEDNIRDGLHKFPVAFYNNSNASHLFPADADMFVNTLITIYKKLQLSDIYNNASFRKSIIDILKFLNKKL